MESNIRIARVWGIEIGASWSWLIVVGIVVWSLAAALFPATYPDLSGGTHLAMAVVTTVLFFCSVLLHELGHARLALREGVPLEGITLWLFGGVAKMRGSPATPGAAFRVSVAGPVVSLVLALAFGAVAYIGAGLDVYDGVQGVVDYLARINLLVLLFNLVPALPLDGGRLLHAWIWHRTGRFTESTVFAANAGRAFGYLLIAVGVLGLLSGSGLGGIWIALIGWFLTQAAGAEAHHALMRRALGSVRVRDSMTPEPATVTADRSVEGFLEEAWRARHSSYPVVDKAGELVGLVAVRSAGEVPAEQRSEAAVSDIMTPAEELSTVDAGEELSSVIESGGFTSDRTRIPVLDRGRLVGVLAPSDVARVVELGQAGMPRRDAGEMEDTGRRRSPGLLVWMVVGLIFALVAGLLYTPPVVVLAPGEALAVEEDITVDGATVTEVNGDYLLTSVEVSRTTAIGALIAWVRTDREVQPIGEVVPEGIDPADYFESQREAFDESRRLAAVAGARAAGYDVAVEGDGAQVVATLPDAPAADEVNEGDTIVALDGMEISTAAELRDAVRGRSSGTEVTLTVDRAEGAGREEVTVELTPLPEIVGEPGLGVVITTRNLSADLPFEVSFPERDIGGPSAGLAYAMAVADLLDRSDLAGGRVVAATGTIGAEGDVSPVGGVELKAHAVEDAGAELLLVPELNRGEGDAGTDIEVRSVQSLDDALSVLRATT